jgi:RNA polymerase sigma-70 factor (ECF subfamily)
VRPPPRLRVVPSSGSAAELDESDDALMLRARGGEEAAFEQLVRRHEPMVRGLAWKVLGDEAATRDSVQETFMDLLRALGNYRAQGKFRQYLYRVALNRCRMVARERRTQDRHEGELVRESVGQALPSQEILAREQQRDLASALARLRPQARELLILRFYGGLDHEELAEVFEIPVGTIKSRLHTALRELREIWQGDVP